MDKEAQLSLIPRQSSTVGEEDSLNVRRHLQIWLGIIFADLESGRSLVPLTLLGKAALLQNAKGTELYQPTWLEGKESE